MSFYFEELSVNGHEFTSYRPYIHILTVVSLRWHISSKFGRFAIVGYGLTGFLIITIEFIISDPVKFDFA